MYNPEHLNKYPLSLNNPQIYVDPNGELVLTLYALYCAEAALEYFAKAYILYPPNSGYTDKFRHCWTSCKVKRRAFSICTTIASWGFEGISEIAELLGQKGLTTDWLEDIFANNAGMICGSHLRALLQWRWDDCECCCLDAERHGFQGVPGKDY
jgi:hypothetical protein